MLVWSLIGGTRNTAGRGWVRQDTAVERGKALIYTIAVPVLMAVLRFLLFRAGTAVDGAMSRLRIVLYVQ